MRRLLLFFGAVQLTIVKSISQPHDHHKNHWPEIRLTRIYQLRPQAMRRTGVGARVVSSRST